jgi:hypothetical protein
LQATVEHGVVERVEKRVRDASGAGGVDRDARARWETRKIPMPKKF